MEKKRTMNWWEGRDLGELPDFVKIETRLRGVEIRPIKWCIMPHFRYGIAYNIDGFWFDIPDKIGGLFIPATEKEYLDFLLNIT